MYPFVADFKGFRQDAVTLDYMSGRKPKKTPISIRFDAELDEAIRQVQEEFGMSYGNAVRLLDREEEGRDRRGATRGEAVARRS